MDNQNYQPQYGQQYNQPVVYQPADPNYAATAKDFLTKAIVACVIAHIPVGCIISIVMGSKNRDAIMDYLNRGGLHTDRIKVSSCLSRAAKYAGIGFTITWAFYLLYLVVVVGVVILGAIAAAYGS